MGQLLKRGKRSVNSYGSSSYGYDRYSTNSYNNEPSYGSYETYEEPRGYDSYDKKSSYKTVGGGGHYGDEGYGQETYNSYVEPSGYGQENYDSYEVPSSYGSSYGQDEDMQPSYRHKRSAYSYGSSGGKGYGSYGHQESFTEGTITQRTLTSPNHPTVRSMSHLAVATMRRNTDTSTSPR